MAKKKQDELQYLQMPLPQGQTAYVSLKNEWSGLNMRNTTDTGVLSKEMNISTDEAPYLTPSQRRVKINQTTYAKPIGMFGFDDFLIVIYADGGKIKLDYIQNAPVDKSEYVTHTGIVQEAVSGGFGVDVLRSVVKFNVYDTPENPIDGEYMRRLLIFPDKRAMPFQLCYTETAPSAGGEYDPGIMYWRYNKTLQKVYYTWNGEDWDAAGDTDVLPVDSMTGVPDIRYAAVHLSRLFGVDNDRVYASGFNDYTNWSMDTAVAYNANNAWVSPAQSNTKGDGAFTGITVFQNHVICFKSDYMHEIYNNKNPFRIQDIFAEGAMDVRTIQDVDGNLFFVGGNHVKVYTGGNPRVIDYTLDVGKIRNAAAGSDGRKYYLYCDTSRFGHSVFVYDTLARQWAQESANGEVVSFAHNRNGMFSLEEGPKANGEYAIYKIESGDYSHDWFAETDLSLGKTADIKHIKKIQMIAALAPESNIQVYLLRDGEEFSPNTTQLLCDKTNHTGQEAMIPIRILTRMTANYGSRIRICGFGYARIYQMEIISSKGGALYAGYDI